MKSYNDVENMNKNDCLFCNIVLNKVHCYKIFENDIVLAFLDISPVSKGHILIITKEHYDTYLDMDSLQSSDYFKYVNIIVKLVKNKLNCDGISLLINIGKDAGQEIMHQHVHLIPKWNNKNFIYKEIFFNKKNIDIDNNYFLEIKNLFK